MWNKTLGECIHWHENIPSMVVLFFLRCFQRQALRDRPQNRPVNVAHCNRRAEDTHSFASTVDAVTPSLLREYAVPGAAVG